MNLLEAMLDLVAPEACLICGDEGLPLCSECRPKAVLTRAPACFNCNSVTPDGRTCARCRRETSLAGVSVAAYYDGAIKDLVRRFKFERNRAAGRYLAGLMAEKLVGQFDTIVPVPPAPSRYRQRGFDHTAVLAEELSRLTGCSRLDALVRVRPGRQVGLGRHQRLAGADGSYLATGEVTGKVLVVDDVVTTGATMSACAAALKAAGAESVWGVAAAKH